MGEQIRGAGLAGNMIIPSELAADQDIKSSFTAVRPDEKLFEQLFEHGERLEPTRTGSVLDAICPRRTGPASEGSAGASPAWGLRRGHPETARKVPTWASNVTDPSR